MSQISHEDNSAGWLASAILSLSFSPSLLSFPKRLLPLGLVTLDVSKASSLATREKEGGRGANFGAKILIRGTNADGYSRKFVEKGELGMMGARCLWDREKI